MSDGPSVELFRGEMFRGSRAGCGKWQSIINEMRPNEPRCMTEIGDVVGNSAKGFRVAAKKMGRSIPLRSINGQVWACWVVDEDKA